MPRPPWKPGRRWRPWSPPPTLTLLGPLDATLISCAPKGDLRMPILASISTSGLARGSPGPAAAALRPSVRACSRNSLSIRSGLSGRARYGLPPPPPPPPPERDPGAAPDRPSSLAFLASIPDRAPAGLLDDMAGDGGNGDGVGVGNGWGIGRADGGSTVCVRPRLLGCSVGNP